MIHPTSVSPDGLPPCSSGMTATGSHAYFYSLRGAQPQGEGFGRCCIDSPYRPSSGPFGATFPQGKANPRQVGSLLQSPTVHPLRATQAWPTSPYTPGGLRLANSAYGIRRIGACRRPYKASPEVLCHFSLFSLHFSLFSKKSLPALFQVQGAIFYFSFCRRTSMTRAAWFRCRMATYSARWASSGV